MTTSSQTRTDTPAAAGASVAGLLAERLLTLRAPAEDRLRQQQAIHDSILARSTHIRSANFLAIHVRDLELLFDAYDKLFFAGLFQQVIAEGQLRFRLSTRMSKAGGKTTRFAWKTGQVSYEITIACGLLFDAFAENDRPISACGRLCTNRLEALQRIFEHELVHLGEQICWRDSNCRSARFQNISARHFLHQAHTHQLITRQERAAAAGIRTGCRVAFFFEGRRLTGRVNRITKRATVLVEDSEGQPFSDGRRYRTYYVPIGKLERHSDDGYPALSDS